MPRVKNFPQETSQKSSPGDSLPRGNRRGKNSIPKYRLHKASGQAVVTLNGRDYYLGRHESRGSKKAYDRLIGEWLEAGRAPADTHEPLLILEICVDYVKKSQVYYRKNGKVSLEHKTVVSVLKELRSLYGDTEATDFGPVAFKAFRQKQVDKGLRRTTVNRYMAHILNAFQFAVENEKMPAGAYLALKSVQKLRKGRTPAKECDRVEPVDEQLVEKTLPHLPAIVADMVRLQLATAMRPMEVCLIRPCDVDTSREVWIYTPSEHKMEHCDRKRFIPIGLKAQKFLENYLNRDKTAYCFSPRDSVAEVRRQKSENRTTPLSCGNRPGSNRKASPKREAGEQYTTMTYGRSIRKVCIRMGLPVWSPNQLRKSAATKIRAHCDLESAQIILGHANKAVTEDYYATPNYDAAIEVTRKMG
jgi:integrase